MSTADHVAEENARRRINGNLTQSWPNPGARSPIPKFDGVASNRAHDA